MIILYIGGQGNGQKAQSRPNRLLPTPARRYSYGYCLLSPLMFTDFTATDRWTKKQAHCIYQALMVAIATRHADAVDIKFLVDGRPVWVALPHLAWVEYKKQHREADHRLPGEGNRRPFS